MGILQKTNATRRRREERGEELEGRKDEGREGRPVDLGRGRVRSSRGMVGRMGRVDDRREEERGRIRKAAGPTRSRLNVLSSLPHLGTGRLWGLFWLGG